MNLVRLAALASAALSALAAAAFAPPAAAAEPVRRCAAADAPPAVVTDAQAVDALRQRSLDYVLAHRESGRATITNVVGQRRTRDNGFAALVYAESGRYVEAEAVLTEVLDAQTLSSGSPQHGYFPFELGTAARSGDEIWTIFLGPVVALILDRHSLNLSPAMVVRLRAALGPAAHAAKWFVHSPANTAQQLLRVYLLIRGGEILADQVLIDAGRSRWNEIWEHLSASGVGEAASPNYAKIHLYQLGLIADDVADTTIAAQARAFRRLVWLELTNRYHAPTRNLAGPFTRTLTDRMAYELSGVHFSLYRESRGRIPLAPVAAPTATYFDVGNAEADLHAVLATLFTPSWPEAWAEAATCTPREQQFRERLTSLPQPARPESTGFLQTTTFIAPTTTLGSINRDAFAMTDETRDIVAYATQGGDVGIFRLRIGANSNSWTRIVTVQQRRSVAAAVIGDHFVPANVHSLTLTFEWRGTTGRAPVLISAASSPGDTAVVDWMGKRMRLRFGPAVTGAPVATISQPDGTTLRLAWRVPMTAPAGSDGYNTMPVVLFAFGLELEEPADRHGSSPALAPVELAPDSGSWWRLAWASPDGALAARFVNGINQLTMEQTLDGTAIAPAPVQDLPEPRAAPETTITSGPSGTVDGTSASFAFSSSTPGSTYRCLLSGRWWMDCAGSVSYDGLTPGDYTFQVFATGPAGDADTTPAARAFTVRG